MGSRKQRRQEDEQKQGEDRSKNIARGNTGITKDPSPHGGRETVDKMDSENI